MRPLRIRFPQLLGAVLRWVVCRSHGNGGSSSERVASAASAAEPGLPPFARAVTERQLAASRRLGAETKSALARGGLRALYQVASGACCRTPPRSDRGSSPDRSLRVRAETVFFNLNGSHRGHSRVPRSSMILLTEDGIQPAANGTARSTPPSHRRTVGYGCETFRFADSTECHGGR